MEKRKIFWASVLLLGYLNCILVQGCDDTPWSFDPDHSCAGQQVEIYRDVMENGESKMECCYAGDPRIKDRTKKAVAVSCAMTPCSTTPGAVNCPIRTIRGNEPKRFDEILREKCTTKDGEAGYTSLCCPENSPEGQQAAALGAEPNEFPHMAKLYIPGSCGGTIYNKRWIITASHCIVDKTTNRLKPASEMKAIIGSNSASNEDARYVYKVKKAIPHENYSKLYPNSKTMKGFTLFDIALLEVDRDIEFGPNVKALRIAEPDFEPRDYADQTIIAGWGKTDLWKLSAHLQKANFILRDPENCFDVYNSSTRGYIKARFSKYKEYQDQLLCLGGIMDGKHSGTTGGGDSGGPAICRDPNGQALLCGVTSFGGEDAECKKYNDEENCPPSIFARVSYFNDWIKKHAGKPAAEKDTYKPYVYGQQVPKKRYDHQVHITSATGKPCGGTLVSPDVVITAASCIAKDDGSLHEDLKVQYLLYDLEQQKKVKTFGVANIEILDGFERVGKKANVEKQGNRVRITDNFYKNNLAAIKLDGKTPIWARKIPSLPEEGTLFEEAKEIAFPRSTHHGGGLSLRDYNILDKDECQKRLTRLAQGRDSVRRVSIKVTPDILCGVEKYSGGSQCDRELGGGLICKGKNGKDVLCGVQIFRLCEFSIRNGFMDMSRKVDWVKTVMERL